MNPHAFSNLILELMDENPFAIRAVLKILKIEFTDSIPTLAVTREELPRLLVNLDFVNQHCKNDYEVKAVICHEFLHILLRHTDLTGELSDSEHYAMDAIINAIIHRQMGDEYSNMMANYYKNASGIHKMLRRKKEYESNPSKWDLCWGSLYEGKLVVDDLKEIADDFKRVGGYSRISSLLIGNHEDMGQPLPESLRNSIDQTMKSMNGSGIWRSPKDRGVGAAVYSTSVSANDQPMNKWLHTTGEILKQYLVPDSQGEKNLTSPQEYHIPILNSRDRRAFIKSLWYPFLPDVSWTSQVYREPALAHVYLDVSGSMNAEMPLLVNLLNRLHKYIKKPFWAFSNEVAPARIVQGQLITETSGGTSMACVIDHIKETMPRAAIVVTDGYIEELEPCVLNDIKGCKLHAIVSRDGNPLKLHNIGIRYTQLERLPQ